MVQQKVSVECISVPMAKDMSIEASYWPIGEAEGFREPQTSSYIPLGLTVRIESIETLCIHSCW